MEIDASMNVCDATTQERASRTPFSDPAALDHAVAGGEISAATAAEPGVVAPASNLAALLDQFTASVTEPEAHTIGSFSETVQALHAELAMLAHHFESVAGRTAEAIDIDVVFPAPVPPSTGIVADRSPAAEEALEDLCRALSR